MKIDIVDKEGNIVGGYFGPYNDDIARGLINILLASPLSKDHKFILRGGHDGISADITYYIENELLYLSQDVKK